MLFRSLACAEHLDEGWLIDVAPIEVLGAGQVVKLIAKDSVTRGREQV